MRYRAGPAAAVAAGVLLSAAALAGSLVRVPCLVVGVEATRVASTRVEAAEPQPAQPRQVAIFPLGRGATFDLSFLHSVARCPVVEYFRVGPEGGMVLERSEYAGLGAGLPFSEEGGTVRIREGRIVLEGLHREFTRIALLPLPLTGHRLRVGGRSLDLSTLPRGHGAVVLTVERRAAAAAAAAAISRWIRGT